MSAPQAVILDVEQGSDEWLLERVGRVTGSRVADVLAKPKKKDGELACRLNYKWEIVIEMLTGLSAEHYVSPEMQCGIDTEPLARAAYEIANDVEVEKVGFAIHKGIPRFGASPDGLVGDDGLIEIKCPKSSTHLEYLRAGTPPENYCAQMAAEMACTGRKWCDFVSFDPRLPKPLQMFVYRFSRDENWISMMELEVVQFLKEVDEIVAELKTKVGMR